MRFLLGFAPKHNRSQRKIYYLLYPKRTSINDYIAKELIYLKFDFSLEEILNIIRKIGCGYIIIYKEQEAIYRAIIIVFY
jgi:hypothetical protein